MVGNALSGIETNTKRERGNVDTQIAGTVTRNSANVESKLEKIRKAAEKGENVFPYVLDAVKAYATLGEVCGVLREVYGEWREIIII